MTATKCDERMGVTNASVAPPLPGAIAVNNQMANARVTYAPLAVWKNFHWTCTVTTFAPLAQDRLE